MKLVVLMLFATSLSVFANEGTFFTSLENEKCKSLRGQEFEKKLKKLKECFNSDDDLCINKYLPKDWEKQIQYDEDTHNIIYERRKREKNFDLLSKNNDIGAVVKINNEKKLEYLKFYLKTYLYDSDKVSCSEWYRNTPKHQAILYVKSPFTEFGQLTVSVKINGFNIKFFSIEK